MKRSLKELLSFIGIAFVCIFLVIVVNMFT